MAISALLLTHLISYPKTPFSADYKFPLLPFAIFLIYGIVICEINTWNYRRLKNQLNKASSRLKQIIKIVRVNLLSCTLIFVLLTTAQMVIFQFVMDPFRFMGLLGICLMISLIETGVLIILKITDAPEKEVVTLKKVAEKSETEALMIVRNDELIKFSEKQVHFLIHREGCVFLVDENGQRFTTQFNALSEVEDKLSTNFFRANRQLIVSRQAIQALQKSTNHKLTVSVAHLSDDVTISRYKSHEFKKWLHS